MAIKKVTKATSSAVPEDVNETPVSTSEKKTVKKTVKKTTKEEVVVDDVVSDTPVEDSSDVPTKKRQAPTKESVISDFDDVIKSIDDEITTLRESKNKTKGIKFLRTLNKRLKTLKTQTTRIKHRNASVKRENSGNNSGFLKPVKISSEMAKFTGWDVNELKSRVDVTKYLCNYIRENSLQNPKDRRQIIADPKLAKLIKFDSKKENEPLTYYRLQTYLKSHFIKPDIVA